MAGLKTRPTAPGAPRTLLQGRVSPEAHQVWTTAAAESGVSMAYYLEALALRLVRENGAMPTVPPPIRGETLDIEVEAIRTDAA